MTRNLLRESLEGVPIVDKGGYKYFVHPLTDGASEIDPLLLEEVTLDMMKTTDFDCDIIFQNGSFTAFPKGRQSD